MHVAVSDKSSQLDCMKTELCEKTEELNNLKSDSSRLEEQLNASCQMVKNLEAQQQMSTECLNEQKASLAAANEEKLQLEKVVCEYKEKADLLSTENCELEKSLEMLDAQHQEAVQQLLASRDVTDAHKQDLHLTTRFEASDKLDTESNRIDCSDAGPAEPAPSDSSSLQSEIVQASASDAGKLVEAMECSRLECDPVLSRVETEQSSDTSRELKICKEELQHLQLMIMEHEKTYNDHIVQLSAELESCRNAECHECSSKDCLIDELNTKTQWLEGDRQQLLGDLECCRRELEEEKIRCKAEITELQQQVEELKTQLQHADEQPATSPVADESTASLRAEIASLKESLDDKDSVCKLYELEVERLTEVEVRLTKEVEKQHEVISKSPETLSREQELKAKMEENSMLRQKVSEMQGELEQLQHKLVKCAEVNANVSPPSNHDLPNGGGHASDVDLSTVVENCREVGNADLQLDGTVPTDTVPTDRKDIVQLRSTISQQKDMLDALNSKYASLRNLLEDRSQAVHGSSVLSDVHRLESELREIRADRERLLTVLGEKTREASALRAEVHCLTNVAAASQAALTKAQRDAQHVASQSQQETNQDMKNEAVKKLSRIIKDKDLEINALQLKNATLVQVRD